ncbi:hypothetical protein POTOM_025830 [Populus tomentosa]|uniref:Protein MULTIPOLAR SPINDLE 1 n=1 Tax=Populus tomentosa TaxID=118781 RepID=A0A8X7ZFW1_POPTO|nr:hypothetical protein POTOM_025830 [Populus tomentosa]
MASSEPATDTKTASSPTDDQSLKLAVAISLLRSKLLQKQPLPPPPPPPPSNPTSESDVLRWKRKAKERKQELLRLREDLREAEDASQCDLFPQTALCKCYFFDNLGKLSPQPVGDGSDRRFNDILRRRFLRQVRIKERRKRINNSNIKLRFPDIYSKNEAEQLRAAVDFLVELSDTTSPARVEEANFANWSHQAADFILGFGVCSIASEGIVIANESTICSLFQEGVGCNPIAAVIMCRLVVLLLTFTKEKMCKLIGHNADADRKGSILAVYAIIVLIFSLSLVASLRNLLSIGNNMELIEGIVSRLIVRLVKRMCSPSHGDESRQTDTDTDTQLYIQQLIRKLGCEPHIGQRAILSVSQRISMVAENLLFLDPFDEGFSNMHECLFIMIQLIEFLISDYLLTWSRDEGFDHALNIVSILLFIGFKIKLYKQASETIHMTSDSFIAVLFEEWVTSVLHARKALELLESRNGLYVLYMDRVTEDMTQMRHVFTLLLFSLLLLSQSLPGSAVGRQLDRALTKSQLPQGRQNDVISSLRARKLGVYIRKKARGYPRTRRKSSAIRTQVPSSHVIGSVFAFLGFFLL